MISHGAGVNQRIPRRRFLARPTLLWPPIIATIDTVDAAAVKWLSVGTRLATVVHFQIPMIDKRGEI